MSQSRIPVPKQSSSASISASLISSKTINKNSDDDLKSINDCFITDGLSVIASDSVKLKHLWKKLVRTEQALKDNYNEMESLKKQTREEMKAVESYVAHIRSLSEQRDKLSKEFELENELLKKQMIQIQAERDALYDEARAARQQLVHAGLQHLSGSSIQELVLYFVQERNNMLNDFDQQASKVTLLEEEAASIRNNFERSESKVQNQMSEEISQLQQQLSDSNECYQTAVDDYEKDKEFFKNELKAAVINNSGQIANSKMILEKEQGKLKQQISIQATQYETEISRMKHLIETQTSSTETLNLTHENRVKKLQNEKDALQKTIANFKTKINNIEEESDKMKIENINLKTELNRERDSFIKASKNSESDKIESKKNFSGKIVDLETSANKKEATIRELSSEIVSLQHKISALNETKLSMSNQIEIFSKNDKKCRQEFEHQLKDYKMTFEKLNNNIGDKEQALIASQNRILTLEDSNKTLVHEIQTLSNKLVKIHELHEQETTSLRSELDVLRNVTNTRSDEIHTLTSKYETMYHKSQVDCEELKQEIVRKESERETLMNERNNISAKFQRSKQEIENFEQMNNNLLSKISNLELENSKLSSNLSESQQNSTTLNAKFNSEFLQLKVTIDSLQREKLYADEQLREALNKCTIISNDNTNLSHELSQLHTRLNDTIKNYELLLEEKGTNDSKVEELSTELESYMRKSQDADTQIGLLNEELLNSHNETQQKLAKSLSKNDALNETLKNLKAEIKATQTHSKGTIQALEVRNSELVAKINKLSMDTESLQISLKDKLEQTNKLDEAITSKNEQCQAIGSKLYDVQEKNSQLKQTIAELEGKINCRDVSLAKIGTNLNENQQGLQREKLAKDVILRRNEELSLKLKEFEEKLLISNERYNELMQDYQSVLNQFEQQKVILDELNEYKSRYQQENFETLLLKKECSMLREQLEYLKSSEQHQYTQLATFQERIAEAHQAIKSQKQKTSRHQEKCKQWQNEYNSINSACNYMKDDISSLISRLSATEYENEKSHKLLEEKKRLSIDKLTETLGKVTSEKGKYQAILTELEAKSIQFEQGLSKEREKRESAEQLHQKVLKEKSSFASRIINLERIIDEQKLNEKISGLNQAKLVKENELLEEKYHEALRNNWEFPIMLSKYSQPNSDIVLTQ